ncbi:Phospholipase D beta 1 [Datura stramonium]|uniref:phospholipase D n=1 Tax=Datura stramonium TaxID=4076 RepID=A0ABS8RZ62_DATST|nr:Phospholipase D beta 1 [Datura stramonium]
MIVDDEYVILGSANINQRSLEGTRDTEIAMGAYQPHHTWANKHSGPHAQIYGYRMSLWAEHTGTLEQCFEHPDGHLLKYPVEVDRTGKVKSLPGCETFPDIGGKIIANGSSQDKPFKFLIYGRTGWIGGLLGKLCEAQGIEYVYGSGRLENRSSLETDLATVKPTMFSTPHRMPA